MAAGIFISYRRGEAIREARAVYERLHREFGAQAVFIDLESFDFGEDFVDSLERQLAQCQVMLALIGPQWATATDGRGRRRLTLEDDFVRIELRTALARRGVRVVPMLIDGAELPDADELPEDLRPLLRRQALPLRFASFDADMGRLCASLRRIVSAPGVAAAPAPSTGPGPREEGATSPAKQAPAAPVWSSAAGADEFGRWAEFSVGSVVQRLRWIEPGEFLIGSPDDEPERFPDEGPQHRVRITHAFWLADTACTQGLWLAVMGGKNPAHFTGDMKLPVEQVSHDDVQAFLSALQAKLKDASVLLPTEAQWEYACRAGTTGPFSFGAQITPEQVNYHGNHPYNGGAKGIYRERTVPVKSLPANRWGLHEMHGNVLEWCADGLRKYPTTGPREPMAEPLGPQKQGPEAHRAVRGGSWVVSARNARSAYRREFPCDLRHDYLGFRLALRSDA